MKAAHKENLEYIRKRTKKAKKRHQAASIHWTVWLLPLLAKEGVHELFELLKWLAS